MVLARNYSFMCETRTGRAGTACYVRAGHVLSKWKVHDGGALNARRGKRPGSAGTAAGAAEPAGGPDAAAVVVPARCRHRVGTVLRGPLHLAVLLIPGG